MDSAGSVLDTDPVPPLPRRPFDGSCELYLVIPWHCMNHRSIAPVNGTRGSIGTPCLLRSTGYERARSRGRGLITMQGHALHDP